MSSGRRFSDVRTFHHVDTACRESIHPEPIPGEPGPDITTLRPVRDQTVTDESVAYTWFGPGSRPLIQAGEPAGNEPDNGQLILTLVPASVSLI